MALAPPEVGRAMITDINGQVLREGDAVQLLCKIVSVDPREGVLVRVMNSDMEMLVGCKHDEALGGIVADSELAKFVEIEGTDPVFHANQV